MSMKKKIQREIVEDLDVDVDFDAGEDHVIHNKKKGRRVDDSRVLPKDAHRQAEDEEIEDLDAVEAAAKAYRAQVSDEDYNIGSMSASAPRRTAASGVGQAGQVIEAVERDFNALTSDERLAFLKRESPELLVMLDEVKKYLDEVKQVSAPLHHVLHNVRKSPEQQEVLSFLETKVQLMLSYCMHVTFYLLLKTEGKQVKGHPVLDRLVELRVYLEKLWPLEEKLHYTLNKLLASGSSSAMNIQTLRPVQNDNNGTYKPRGTPLLEESRERRKSIQAAREAEALRKEEERTMTRFQSKASTKANAVSSVRAADEGYQEDPDQFFSTLVDNDLQDDSGLSLIEKLRQRSTPQVAKVTADAHVEEEDEEDYLSDVNSEDYDALVGEQHARDSHAERLKDMPTRSYVETEVDRRKAGKKIESHRGLTKTRPKDRKTPRTAQRRKYERGMQKVKSQVKSVVPEPEEGFVGVRSLRPNVTHSTKLH